LHLAAKNGSIPIFKCFFETIKGDKKLKLSKIYTLDVRNWSYLHYASFNGHKNLCRYLLELEFDRGKLRDIKNSQGKTALIFARDPETKEGFKCKF